MGARSGADVASKLTARKVETAKPGKYSDGGNLYLIVSETGARKWVLRFTWRGRAKEMGLGSASSVPLADAREKAAGARRKIAQGLNPIDERKRDGGIPTFGEMADDVRETVYRVIQEALNNAVRHVLTLKYLHQRYTNYLRWLTWGR